MKKKILLLGCVILLALTLVPAINLKLGNLQKKEAERWWKISVLYNFDFALPFISRFLYPFGISMSPNQVIIGKDGWLYLGDQYEKTLTVTRRGAMKEDEDRSKRIGLAMDSWKQWLKQKGVNLYRVMLGPNKSTIYPEFLPNWVQPAADSTTNVLIAHINQELYVDTRSSLTMAKRQFSEPLYYQTDTHWNNLGAWVAFRAFTMEVAKADPGLRRLSDQQVRISSVGERTASDLANFLWMQESLRDSEVFVEIVGDHPIETEQYDFETGQLILSGSNPVISTPQRPLLVKSKYALNQKKILWLRDSFGTALAPYMAATFSEILQLHYGVTDPEQFARLVDSYKPDYVFITVVERDALGSWFEKTPPPRLSSGKQNDFVSLGRGIQTGINDMTTIEGTKTYQISGADPFITFTLPSPVQTEVASQIAIEFNCEKKELVPIQILWHTADTVFTEANSIRATIEPGMTTIDLLSIASWKQTGTVTDLRVDFDSASTCSILSFKSLELGKSAEHLNTL